MTIKPEYIVARAIWEDRYPEESWDYARWTAEETADGGNGRYITIMGHARAALDALREAGLLK